jgi:hypothetical protein
MDTVSIERILRCHEKIGRRRQDCGGLGKVERGLFKSYYVACSLCGRSGGLEATEEEAISDWNQIQRTNQNRGQG